MIHSNQLLRSVFLCLPLLWSGILFDKSLPAPPSALLDNRGSSVFTLSPRFTRSDSITSPDHFLTLPFHNHTDMQVVQGWIYEWGYAHLGIDFIRGEVDFPETWDTFEVIAAADGEACVNCVDGPGNRIWIKHTINHKAYYTYYGHLASIEPSLLNSKWGSTVKVTRGQKIGMAGNTGTLYVHLHFGVYTAPWNPVDPYDLYTDRSSYYPNPTYQRMGSSYLFWCDPPPDPSQVDPDPLLSQYILLNPPGWGVYRR